jgi:hypothetical protein
MTTAEYDESIVTKSELLTDETHEIGTMTGDENEYGTTTVVGTETYDEAGTLTTTSTGTVIATLDGSVDGTCDEATTANPEEKMKT